MRRTLIFFGAHLLLLAAGGSEPGRAITIATNDGIAFVRIAAGSYVRGTTPLQRKWLEQAGWWTRFEQCEQPAREVILTRPFWISQCEITQAQWVEVMKKNPSAFKGDTRPVESVSWADVIEFIQKLTAKGNGKYRLPTEAEWEFCCRAGGTNLFGSAAEEPITGTNLEEYAWFRENAAKTTHPVGAKKPNAWGLYDLHGNVWEWCEDWYAADFYASAALRDPVNRTPGTERVLRGGSWFLEAKYLRAASRSGNLPSFKSQYVGFRLVREAEEHVL